MSILKSTKEAYAAQAAAAAEKAAEDAAAARAAKEAAAAAADAEAPGTAPVGAKIQALGSAASGLLSRARAATKPAAKGAAAGAPAPESTLATPLTPVGSIEYQAPAGETAPATGLRRHRHLLRPLGVGVLVLGVLFFVLQANLLSAQRDAAQTLHTAAQQALPALAKPLDNARESVADATKNPQLLALLASPGDDASARAQAVQRMRESLPQAQAVAFFAPNADALVDTNLAKLGYVRAAQLARAQGSNATQVSVITTAGKHVLSVVQPVQQGSTTLAYAAVDLPFTAVAKAFADLPRPRGRVDLRLAGQGDAPVLLSRGASPETDIDYADQVPGSGLWLTTAQPASTAMLPVSTSPTLAWVVAILCFLGALAVAAGEQRLRALPQRVRGQGGRGGGSEPTFAQVLNTGGKVLAAAPASPTAEKPAEPELAGGVAVERSIFRAYDIRGVLGETLDAGVAKLIGQAIGSAARDKGMTEIVVGRDGRLSGPDLVDALSDGLRASGMDVIDIGAMPTPVVYFACYHLNTRTGVVVTGSHNPPDYNGFKIVIDNVTLAEDAIQDLYSRITEGRFSEGRGELRHVDVAADYIERIASDVQTERPLNVVVDCGNGIAGAIAPQVLESIGAKVTPLYDEVDGNFPNHHPDPSDPRNLADLILAVKHQNADLGIAFDGDADRLGVVTKDGEIVYADRLLMLFAIDVLARDPGATIIYDVKCTGHLQSMILRHGGSPLMWRTGHSLIKAKMRETGAALAGEMSGHFFFKERWYGFDDGIYAAARLLEILASDTEQRTPEQIFAALPNGVSTPELKIAMNDGARFIAQFSKQAHFQDARITKIDGVRADWPDGWGLVRASNTTPTLVLRFDADSADALTRIEEVFRAQLLELDAGLKLPF